MKPPTPVDRTEPLHPNVKPKAGANGRRKVRALWISDLHLGMRASKAAELLAFLDTVAPERVYLVGDILDFWKLRRKVHWPAVYTALLAHVTRLAESGVEVIYVPGNHDAEFRGQGIFHVAGVSVRDEVIHHTADGRRLLVTHGDRFDDYGNESSFLVAMGDRAYASSIVLSEGLSSVRRALGLKPWSLSLWLKQKVKSVVGFVGRFEDRVVEAARERHVDGIVCGHIHKAELRLIDGVLYANDGDWVESCTALVEDASGALELLYWDGDASVCLARDGGRAGAAAASSSAAPTAPLRTAP